MHGRLILTARLVPWLLGAWLVGCSGDDADDTSDAAGGAGADTMGNCTFDPGADDPRAEEYLPGMTKQTDNGLEIALVESEPDPPARDDNTWDISIKDADGEPAGGAHVELEPFMPDHRHGPPRKPELEELDDGHYRAEPVTFHMPGFWTIDVGVWLDGESVADDPGQWVQFAFCIQ